MKNKIKIYKILLLCAIVLLIGCSKDDYNLQNSTAQKPQPKSYRLTRADANAVALRLNQKMNTHGSSNIDGSMHRVNTINNILSYSPAI